MNKNNQCRVCGAMIAAPSLSTPSPSLTSVRTVLNVPTEVYVCENCEHAQSPDLPDVKEFYDTGYRISLDVEGHDQLYENRDGVSVFRTEVQAEMMSELGLENGAKVLDFGAGKATTLQQYMIERPDIHPFVFDVSNDYSNHWQDWIPSENQATYKIPEHWKSKFDLITAHFVIEHVPNPVETLRDIGACLAPGGKLFFSVPNPTKNSGDLLVIDHLNHFSRNSLTRALAEADLTALTIDDNRFAGAFVIVAQQGKEETLPGVDTSNVKKSLKSWQAAIEELKELSKEISGKDIAIYGAGFYGSLAAINLGTQARCFLDRNPYLQKQPHMGLPVLPPENCPASISAVVVALNPRIARSIVTGKEEWLPKTASVYYVGGDPD